MAHNTLNGGTVTEIGGGKAMLNGTVYEVDSGKAMYGGAVHPISFGGGPCTVNVQVNTRSGGKALAINTLSVGIYDSAGALKTGVSYSDYSKAATDGSYGFPSGYTVKYTTGGDSKGLQCNDTYEAISDEDVLKLTIDTNNKYYPKTIVYLNGVEVASFEADSSTDVIGEWTTPITGNTTVKYDRTQDVAYGDNSSIASVYVTMEG